MQSTHASAMPHWTRRSVLLGGAAVLLVLELLALLYGLAFVWADSVAATSNRPENPDGRTLTFVWPGGLYDRAGVRRGDVLLSIDGVPARSRRPEGPFTIGRETPLIVRRGSQFGRPAEGPVETLYVVPQPALTMSTVPVAAAGLILRVAVELLVLAIACRATNAPRASWAIIALGLVWAFEQLFGAAVYRWAWLPGEVGLWIIYFLSFFVIKITWTAWLHVFLNFPAKHPLMQRLEETAPRRLRPLGGWYTILYAATVLMAAYNVYFQYVYPSDQPIGKYTEGLIENWGIIMFGLSTLVLIDQARRAVTPLQRYQAICLAIPVAIMALAWTYYELAVWVLPTQSFVEGFQSKVWLVLAHCAVPTALVVAALRYGLFELKFVVRAGLLWFSLTALLVVGYLAVAALLGRGVATVFGAQAAADPTVFVFAALVVAPGAQPMHRQLQRSLDRWLFRDREALQRFQRDASETLRRAQPAPTITQLFTDRAVQELQLAGAWVVTRQTVNSAGSAVTAPPLPGQSLLDRLRDVALPVVLSPEPFSLRHAKVIASDDPALAPWARAGATLFVPLRTGAPTPPPASVRRGLVREVPAALLDQPELIAVWVLAARDPLDVPEPAELAALLRLAQAAAVLLDYSRLSDAQVQQAVLQHDVERARQIQHRLLPARLPDYSGSLAWALRFQPARTVSGDFYDILPLTSTPALHGSPPPFQVVLGDVTGKGVPAALIMALAQTTLRTLAEREANRVAASGPVESPQPPAEFARPERLLRQASHLLYRYVGRGAGGKDFVACALAILEPGAMASVGTEAWRLHLANAAQLPPLLVRRGHVEELTVPGDRFPLGVMPDAAYQAISCELEPGDVLVFASDGLVEAHYQPGGSGAPSPPAAELNVAPAVGELFGFERFEAAVARWAVQAADAEAIATGIWQEVTAWTGGASDHDDMTLLVLHVVA